MTNYFNVSGNDRKKIEVCQRCQDVFVELYSERVSRKLRDAAKLCPECLARFEQVKKARGLSKIYYMASHEPSMF